jgi:hypothetical protein
MLASDLLSNFAATDRRTLAMDAAARHGCRRSSGPPPLARPPPRLAAQRRDRGRVAAAQAQIGDPRALRRSDQHCCSWLPRLALRYLGNVGHEREDTAIA